ncbi:energy transducer TonB family protein [Marinicella litoralis]|uniref:TonB family protein n=1 Tax=Marinicella litoralis TaxID=644220 RepID=A0A4R6Y375_9GAMM|nr:energy transducer TonB [Marinicella litoralis]TDR23488.1 hypothetical protein C8D91_0350 [Marinicella litoralis]
MKYLILFSLLLTVNSQAQEPVEDKPKNQKRPSWSQGLPERQSSMTPTSSINKFKVKQEPMDVIEDDRSLELTELPSVEIEMMNTQPVIELEPVMELEVETVQPVAATREEAFDQYFSSKGEGEVKTEVNPLVSEYKWTLLKSLPIEVPQNFSDNETLKLNIHINPKGHVTRVTVAEASIPKKIFESAEKSILKWRFEAPAEIGINEVISKTFSIDIKTDA